jgi:hypothetical protein
LLLRRIKPRGDALVFCGAGGQAQCTSNNEMRQPFERCPVLVYCTHYAFTLD